MRFPFLLLFVLSPFILISQENNQTYSILTDEEVGVMFNDNIRAGLGITYPIFRVFSWSDFSGAHYLVLSERNYKEAGQQVYNDSIKAFNIKMENSNFKIEWQARDFKNNDEQSSEKYESSIWFWTKYCVIEDLDLDGLSDIILVYGTNGDNGYDDGRIKILVYWKGSKFAIRHQNSPYDGGRKTQVDASFYSLPAEIQQRTQKIMQTITDNNHGIFPAGWKEKMKQQALFISE